LLRKSFRDKFQTCTAHSLFTIELASRYRRARLTQTKATVHSLSAGPDKTNGLTAEQIGRGLRTRTAPGCLRSSRPGLQCQAFGADDLKGPDRRPAGNARPLTSSVLTPAGNDLQHTAHPRQLPVACSEHFHVELTPHESDVNLRGCFTCTRGATGPSCSTGTTFLLCFSVSS
jgi:hypothetical protein